MIPAPASRSSFTKFEAHGDRLSKLYELGADGKVIKSGGTQLSNGRYETVSIEAADPQAALAEIGARIDALNFREAIGLGVVAMAFRCRATSPPRPNMRSARPASAQRRSRGRCRIFAGLRTVVVCCCSTVTKQTACASILVELFPDFANVAVLTRPSASASVKDPNTGERLKTGEHLYVLLDEPAKSKDCLTAIMRLAWCVGVGRSAGWLALAKDGDPLVYGPCRRHRRLARAPGLRGRDLDRQRS